MFHDFDLELTQIRSTENRFFQILFFWLRSIFSDFFLNLSFIVFFYYKYFKQKFLGFEIQRFQSTSENAFKFIKVLHTCEKLIIFSRGHF